MKNTMVFFLGFFLMFPSWALDDFDIFNINGIFVFNRAIPSLKNLNWQVGEFQERQVKKGALRVGTLKSWVDREEGAAFWLLNEIKVIFKKKQFVEALVDRQSGEILKYIVDGEEKDPPSIAELEKCEEVSEAGETVTVPAGKFDSQRSIVRCDQDVMALWVNDVAVNMGGHVRQAVLKDEQDPKSIEYLIELTQFGKK